MPRLWNLLPSLEQLFGPGKIFDINRIPPRYLVSVRSNSVRRASFRPAARPDLSDSDQHLIDQFRATGQIDLLEEVLQRQLRPIRDMVFQMVLNHDAADDVTQDIFLRVVRGIDRFEGRSEFSTWLFRIAMNTVHSYLKNRGLSRVEFCNELPAESTVSRLAPDGPVLQAELSSEIQAALARLSPQLRAAIVLVCLQGHTAAEAANIEDCSTDTMYWRVHEARRQLKELLAEHLQ